MNAMITSKACMACGKTVRGRADKKFCDDLCRNSFNNRLKADNSNFVRNVNNVLRKNRRILESLLPETVDTAKATREKLLQLGFHFKYNTHVLNNRKGNTYFFCYEYGYLPLENSMYLLVRRKEES
jgi:predicted nucleic acid-binding Zn ribbon protein